LREHGRGAPVLEEFARRFAQHGFITMSNILSKLASSIHEELEAGLCARTIPKQDVWKYLTDIANE
jgi:hypothetical protein